MEDRGPPLGNNPGYQPQLSLLHRLDVVEHLPLPAPHPPVLHAAPTHSTNNPSQDLHALLSSDQGGSLIQDVQAALSATRMQHMCVLFEVKPFGPEHALPALGV